MNPDEEWLQYLMHHRTRFPPPKLLENPDVNGAYDILKKAFLDVVEADRIEDTGLYPSRWRPIM